MFNIGFSELIILGIIGLVVLGPEQLPQVARKLARLINDLKRAKDEVFSPVEDMRKEANQFIEKVRHQAKEQMNAVTNIESPTQTHPQVDLAIERTHEIDQSVDLTQKIKINKSDDEEDEKKKDV